MILEWNRNRKTEVMNMYHVTSVVWVEEISKDNNKKNS